MNTGQQEWVEKFRALFLVDAVNRAVAGKKWTGARREVRPVGPDEETIVFCVFVQRWAEA